MSKARRIVLGVSGSIAAVKAPELARLLVEQGFDVQCLMTKEGAHFASSVALGTFTGKPVHVDMFSDEAYKMPHIAIAEQADLLLVAPASCTLLARCAHGLAEDMVSLCYVTTKAPALFAPAMHPTMWDHPATQENVKLLRSRGAQFVGPAAGLLADNTKGDGRMSEPIEIVKVVEKILNPKL